MKRNMIKRLDKNPFQNHIKNKTKLRSKPDQDGEGDLHAQNYKY